MLRIWDMATLGKTGRLDGRVKRSGTKTSPSQGMLQVGMMIILKVDSSSRVPERRCAAVEDVGGMTALWKIDRRESAKTEFKRAEVK